MASEESLESKPLLVVGLGTYKRPGMLRKALVSSSILKTPMETDVVFVVCDNDVEQSAKSVYEEVKSSIPFPSTYLNEPNQGIVKMRNKVLDHAILQNAKYLAFFDDDEELTPDWLVNLLETLNTYAATAVGGPLDREMPSTGNLAEEVREFLQSFIPTGRTGEKRRFLGSGNVLIDLHFVKKFSLRFKEVFNLLGGEDTFFFKEIVDLGGSLVWCQEAVLKTEVDPRRLTEEYALELQYRFVQYEYHSRRLTLGKLSALVKALELLYKHSTTIIRKRMNGSLSRFEELRRKMAIKGLIHAISGKVLEPYKTTDGY